MPQVATFPFPNRSGSHCTHTLSQDLKIPDSQRPEPELPARALKKQEDKSLFMQTKRNHNVSCPSCPKSLISLSLIASLGTFRSHFLTLTNRPEAYQAL